MNQQELKDMFKEMVAESETIFGDKGNDYVFNDDALATFTDTSAWLKGAPMDQATICVAFMLKQMKAICNATVRRQPLKGESLATKLDDLMNYAILTRANFHAIDTTLLYGLDVK